MNSTSEPIAYFVIYLGVWSCGMVNFFALKRIFKKRHPKEFKRLFLSFPERSMASGLRQTEYIWKRGYSTIDDPAFVKRCDIHRWIHFLCLAGIAVGLIAGLFLFRHHPIPA
jgi:hypothetical protein